MNQDSTLIKRIAKESGTSPKQVGATLDLLEKQTSISFIARYRKEVTGNLEEAKIRLVEESHGRYRAFLKRREQLLGLIEEQGKLTEDLRKQLLECFDESRLEDLYSQFRTKESKKVLAAREKGLESLAKQLWEQAPGKFTVDALAEKYLSEEKGIATKDEAIEGAIIIVAGWISNDAAIRDTLRKLMASEGFLVSKVVEGKAGKKTKYESVYDFRQEISRVPFHRITTIRRGVREGILTIQIELDEQKALKVIREKVIHQSDSPCASYLERTIQDAYVYSLKPLLESDVRSKLKERCDNEALKLFQANLTNLLLAPPVGSFPIIGIDPAASSACRIAVIDAKGAYLEHATFGPGLPRKNRDRAEAILYRLIQRHGTHAIAIGNGVGSREIERFVKGFLSKYHSGHVFDLSLVRGKVVRSKDQQKKSKELDGLTEAEGSKSPKVNSSLTTEKVKEVSSPGKESLPVKLAEDVDGDSEQSQQKKEVDIAPEGRMDSLTSEDLPSPKTSLVADDATKHRIEDSQEDSEKVLVDPVDNTSSMLTEPAPTVNPIEQAIPNAEVSQRSSIFSAIVHKGGTGVFATSEAARKEFPGLDLGIRAAISIARRMQDPLAELAKIHPKAILAGPELQEVNQRRLTRRLNGTLESCINHVGVNLNTVSEAILAHVAGVDANLAKNIVQYRQQHGSFLSRTQLMNVPGFTESIFEQAAGFLRIPEGGQPLDGTLIHPECYELVERMAKSVQVTVPELLENPKKGKDLDLETLSDDRFGVPTLQDIQQELSRGGQDRRKAFVPPSFREDVKELSDLNQGMLVEGTVSNVTNFGAFVDIGLKQEGLIHISELTSRFLQHANQAVHVGQVVKAKVIGVDATANRISLSIRALQVPENTRKRKPKKVIKLATRVPIAKPKNDSTRELSGHGDKRSRSKSDGKPLGRKRPQRKKRENTEASNLAFHLNRSNKAEVEVLPDTSNLSFSEKIRLLQEKFSGIR